MALRAIQRVDRPVFLWIDQICINQSDPDEKSRQIPPTDRIYFMSDKNNGWPSESTSRPDLAMDYLHDIGTRAQVSGLGSLDDNILQVILSDEDAESDILQIDPTFQALRW
ncbi:hypothetical protein B0T14DRAFT_89204 [Immersiella caudata]|uniref:Heterokaryon incompatibility domain-containing protein n=1 Tax=Immersiella caudata TaxID=314043 RepID=A0AA39X2U5_9PEZI|nr:hypothetical protein B0T14DRAFT_89204 [Immersiella caudata]